jgi:hypothetical protein
MNDVIEGSSKVRFAYISLVKKNTSQIAIIECGLREISFGKVHFMQRATRELRLFAFDLIERREIQHAGIEAHFE